MQSNVHIGVFGLWHLGAVITAAWSKLGFKVTAFDYSEETIKKLERGEPSIFEPGLKETLQESKKNGLVFYSREKNDLKNCDFIFLTYDTAVLENNESDLTILRKAIKDISSVVKNEALVIVSSQVPVGTCAEFRKIIQEKNINVELVYSPENLRLGEAIACYLEPGRIVIGGEKEAAITKALSLFQYIKAGKIAMNLKSAEMVKHAINSFLANSIVFTNELADLCESSGADILDVVKGMKTDSRIGEKAYLAPGIGFSGGTLGRDLKALSNLSKISELSNDFFGVLHEFNLLRKQNILNKARKILGGSFDSKAVAILGLTYKSGTSTLRRSLPIEIVNLMANEGAILKAYDPKANYSELSEEPRFFMAKNIEEAISGSNLIVLFTEWPEFKTYNWEKGRELVLGKVFFDTKNYLYDLKLDRLGYNYIGVGLSQENITN